MSFGFSAGDFVTAASLIIQAGLALRDAGGSSQEYRHLHLYLSNLKRILDEVDRLEAPDALTGTLDAIKATALSCQYPLQEFVNGVKRYDASLGIGQSVGLMKDVEMKLKWRATKKAEAVVRLQAELAGKRKSVERHNRDRRLTDIEVDIKQIRESVDHVNPRVSSEMMVLQRNIETSVERNSTGLQNLQSSVVSTLYGLLGKIGNLENVVRNTYNASMENYKLLIAIQSSLPPPDTRHTYFQDPMHVEDAFGRVFPVPAEYNWTMLEAVIKARFAHGPGHELVRQYSWQLFYSEDSRYGINSTWAEFRPGMKITMAVVVPKYDNSLQCPRPGCPSAAFREAREGGKMCALCDIWFDPLPYNYEEMQSQLEDTLRHESTHISEEKLEPQPNNEVNIDLSYLKNVRFASPLPKAGEDWFARSLFDFDGYDYEYDSRVSRANATPPLSFRAGDIVRVIGTRPGGWWDVILNNERGWIPCNYFTYVYRSEHRHLSTTAIDTVWEFDEL